MPDTWTPTTVDADADGDPARTALLEACAELAHDAWCDALRYLLDEQALITSSGIAVVDAKVVTNLRKRIDLPYQRALPADRDRARAQVTQVWPAVRTVLDADR